MCVWQELPGETDIKYFYSSKKIFFKYIFSPGYDTEYTETDRKDIQNLAQEIETKYNNYGEGIANKFAN